MTDVKNKAADPDKIEFDTPVQVTYCLPGGVEYTTTGVDAIKENQGALILYKTDGTFTKVASGWLSYDIQEMV